MSASLRPWALPIYLFLCLLAGGSRQGVWSNAALQLLAVLLLAWAALAPREQPRTEALRQLITLIAASLLLIVLQLIPLPSGLWSELPSHETAASGFALLGYELPWLPLSMAPYATLGAAYALLPPIAAVALIVAFGAQKERWIAVAILAGALASVLLGAVQVASGGRASWAYLYDITNIGAVGFFANRNHMAALLLAAIPFAGALFASGQPRSRGSGRAFAMLAIGAGGFLLVVAGLLLNDSLAALALAVPVIAMTALMMPAGWRMRRLVVPIALVALVAAAVVLGSGELADEMSGASGVARGPIWGTTVRLIGDSFPFGTGIGTFPQVFALYEDPAAVGRVYVNHAHSDYLEIILETGLAGAVLLALFLAWWAAQAVRVWRSLSSSPFAKAATIASGAILVHSIVDYPLRTAAISAVFAACIGLMAQTRPRGDDEPRHIRIA